jgi:hypothetical protein
MANRGLHHGVFTGAWAPLEPSLEPGPEQELELELSGSRTCSRWP